LKALSEEIDLKTHQATKHLNTNRRGVTYVF